MKQIIIRLESFHDLIPTYVWSIDLMLRVSNNEEITTILNIHKEYLDQLVMVSNYINTVDLGSFLDETY